jgi:hypothetical protein
MCESIKVNAVAEDRFNNVIISVVIDIIGVIDILGVVINIIGVVINILGVVINILGVVINILGVVIDILGVVIDFIGVLTIVFINWLIDIVARNGLFDIVVSTEWLFITIVVEVVFFSAVDVAPVAAWECIRGNLFSFAVFADIAPSTEAIVILIVLTIWEETSIPSIALTETVVQWVSEAIEDWGYAIDIEALTELIVFIIIDIVIIFDVIVFTVVDIFVIIGSNSVTSVWVVTEMVNGVIFVQVVVVVFVVNGVFGIFMDVWLIIVVVEREMVEFVVT